MNKKMLDLLICMLFIVTALIPFVSAIKTSNNILKPGMVDQIQPSTTTLKWLENGKTHWQQFKNRGKHIEEVELHFGQWYPGSADITLSIEESLGATPITSITYPATYFTYNVQQWYTFDVPDAPLTYGKIYYIVLRFGPSSEYAWSGDTGNPYPSGGSSDTDPDWDYAFKTIVDKSKPVNLEKSSEKFISCYIETTIHGEFDSIGTHPELGLYLYMSNNEYRETTIYSEKGGDILWQSEGAHALRIWLFLGYNQVTEESSTMYGRAFFVRPI